jgi:hypothetical protein
MYQIVLGGLVQKPGDVMLDFSFSGRNTDLLGGAS